MSISKRFPVRTRSGHGTMLLVVLLFVGGSIALHKDRGCDLTPPDITNGHPKKSGDNGFSIVISANPDFYVPGEAYTVTLKNINSEATMLPRFIAFTITVEPAHKGKAGSFELIDNTVTQIPNDCPTPTTVLHTSLNHKSEVSVRWRAPISGSGCVYFKGLVVEQKNSWYAADGWLTKQLCEEDFHPEPRLDECQACSEAKYLITFESVWSRQTHPKDFPSAEASFSDIIGASHSNMYTMWEQGTKPTEGMQHIAQGGDTSVIESEFVNNSNFIRTIIKTRGLKQPSTKTFAVFRVDPENYLLSIAGKIIPSPDWIVGVSNFPLCHKDGKWLESETLPLFPYDAGTDASHTYKEKFPLPKGDYDIIRRITPSYPNNENSPFFDESGDGMHPLAKLIITKERQYDMPCSQARHMNDDLELECDTTEWGAWSPCSVSCGEGYRKRTRMYSFQAPRRSCTKLLSQHQRCRHRACDDMFPSDPPGRRCEVSLWSPWSPCTPACGKGTRFRTRHYINKQYESHCTLRTREEESCYTNGLQCTEVSEPCATTSWSSWSPCSVSCGKGVQYRTRTLIDKANEHKCNTQTTEKQSCIAERDQCIINPEEARTICTMNQMVGPCRGYFPRWYYNNEKKGCMHFVYGGCRGNQNNFESFEECNKTCHILSKNEEEQPLMQLDVRSLSVDCKISSWSEWSECTVTCGKGHQERSRTILAYPKNGGKECPKKSAVRKRCNPRPC